MVIYISNLIDLTKLTDSRKSQLFTSQDDPSSSYSKFLERQLQLIKKRQI